MHNLIATFLKHINSHQNHPNTGKLCFFFFSFSFCVLFPIYYLNCSVIVELFQSIQKQQKGTDNYYYLIYSNFFYEYNKLAVFPILSQDHLTIWPRTENWIAASPYHWNILQHWAKTIIIDLGGTRFGVSPHSILWLHSKGICYLFFGWITPWSHHPHKGHSLLEFPTVPRWDELNSKYFWSPNLCILKPIGIMIIIFNQTTWWY